MIAYFKVLYEYVNRGQIVTFNARLITKKVLGDMSVSDVAIKIPSGTNVVDYETINDLEIYVFTIIRLR